MPSFTPGLGAGQVHARLTETLREEEAARKNLVLWFADLYRRKLYLELGYTSVYAYMVEAHGFSKTRCAQFVRIAESLGELPVLRRALAAGELPWTRAREVVKVATPETDRAWVEEARQSSRRALERKVAVAQGRTKATCGPGRDQAVLALAPGSAPKAEPHTGERIATSHTNDSDSGTAREGSRPVNGYPDALPAAAAGVHLKFSPILYARFGAAIEALRKQGWKGSVEELLVVALDHLTQAGGEFTRGNSGQNAGGKFTPGDADQTASAEFTRGNSEPKTHADTPGAHDPGPRKNPETTEAGRTRPAPLHPVYQVVIHQCDDCGRGSVMTGRGPKPLPPAELRAILCDARILRRGERNRTTIPPSLRSRVLERDRHRCRVAGCGSTRFLSVHHRRPRSAGGKNTPDNLITVCASCHRAIHTMAERSPGFVLPLSPRPG